MEEAMFKQFDVVSDNFDHYYRSNATKDCFTNAQSSVHRRIMKEWRILQDCLPETIFVQVYKTRINLLRAAVIGAAGTPYHDGLFFFDIAFPPDYPSQPPMVNYRSFGYCLNPNLHDTGYICLSLLNTCPGRNTKGWIPGESTVLQILLSLQSLVLNENPYFNVQEPSTPRTEKARKRSIMYDGIAFVLTCRSTLGLIRNPPRNFESLVRWHFGRRANAILMACEQYANGRTRVGFYESDPTATAAVATVKVSKRLRTAIAKWYPVMVASFQGIGANLLDGVEVLRLEERKVEESENEGVLKEVYKKIIKHFWDIFWLEEIIELFWEYI